VPALENVPRALLINKCLCQFFWRRAMVMGRGDLGEEKGKGRWGGLDETPRSFSSPALFGQGHK
jgi:hypothetical protein